MYKDINELLENMRDLQEQMETLFDDTREQFRYTLEGGRVRFSREVKDFQRRFRVSSLSYILTARLSSVLTAPVVYSMVVPLVMIDLTFTLYQHICFRAYGILRVRRRDFLVNDRHKLAYLNTIEKVNCAYCGYANGVIAYAREIFSRTEQYWCPIRHAHRVRGAHTRYPKFFNYGDAEAYQTGLEEMRRKLGPQQDGSKPHYRN
ncbi:MAG: hypothetical protein KAJ06_06115 [Gammaproteobacteria bacterium]|nr:hypothetical protein [Gammaproteobacteria bacterium]